MDPVGCLHSALGDGANQINQNAAAYPDCHYCYSLQGCAAVNFGEDGRLKKQDNGFFSNLQGRHDSDQPKLITTLKSELRIEW